MRAFARAGSERHNFWIETGVVLRFDNSRWKCWAEPEEATEATDKQIADLAALIDVPAQKIHDTIDKRRHRSFVYLTRQLEVEKGELVRAMQIPGIYVSNEVRRNYPDGEISVHIVGFTDSDNNGREGVELADDAKLKGKQGARRVIRDRLGRIVEDVWVKEVSAGNDVVLSIDSRLQYVAHNALQQAIERHEAKAGAVVVVDVHTGEILAMRIYRDTPESGRRTLRFENVRNRVLTDTFEPGSTMKPFAIAKALDLGIVRPGHGRDGSR